MDPLKGRFQFSERNGKSVTEKIDLADQLLLVTSLKWKKFACKHRMNNPISGSVCPSADTGVLVTLVKPKDSIPGSWECGETVLVE
jgi:hypothetical protein